MARCAGGTGALTAVPDVLAIVGDAADMMFADAQDALFEGVIQPLMYAAGLASYLEDGFDAAGWLLVGVCQLATLILVLGPLQRWRPFEPPPRDAATRKARRAAVRVDVIYTLIHRLGLHRVLLFFAVDPVWNRLFGWLTVHGIDGGHLDQWIAPVWPGVTDTALAGLLAYLLVLDSVNYLLHRAQHRFEWWWALHALHHSQRHMTMWTDSRNHLLDTVMVDTCFVLVARIIGVPPAQFVLIVAASQLLENLAHANFRFSFGWLGERLIVGPFFHRLHHAIGLGHESNGSGTLGGRNFAVLFPVWDVVFGTSDFSHRAEPTGVRDQLPEAGGRDYGNGFWSQQWLGLKRLVRVR